MLKRVCVAGLIVLGLGVGRASAEAPEVRTLRVKAYIDGRSWLVIQGGTAYWQHLDFAAPGRWQGVRWATTLGDADWMPLWPDVPDAENRSCNCDSTAFARFPPLASVDQTVTVSVSKAREPVLIVKQPRAANDYTLTVDFNDNPDFGADWYDVELRYLSADRAHYGGDSSLHPGPNGFPAGKAPYEMYFGRLGQGIRNGVETCYIPGVGSAAGEPMCSGFQLPAATMSRSTYGFWLLKGPGIFKGDAYAYGRLQAETLLEQWRRFHSISINRDLDGNGYPDFDDDGVPLHRGPVVDGRTLFGDIEYDDESNTRGWCVCPFPAYPSGKDCPLNGNPAGSEASCHGVNRLLLQGFMDAIAAAPERLQPGVYISPLQWTRIFGPGFQPVAPTGEIRPFALWVSGCGPGHGIDATEAQQLMPVIQSTTLGGMSSVLWQYQLPAHQDLCDAERRACERCRKNPRVCSQRDRDAICNKAEADCVMDFDVSGQNPVDVLRPVPSEGAAYQCTCSDGGVRGTCYGAVE